MAHRMFEGKEQASSYWKYRFPPADHIMQQVLDFLDKQKGRPFELAVDVGCGSGQGTVELAKHFASVVGMDFIAAFQPYRCPHLGSHSLPLYQEAYGSIPYPDKEWHESVHVKRPMPLSSFIGLVESFSNYQALLRDDPQKATRLSQDISQRLMSAMGVTSMETEVEVIVKNFFILASKPEEV